VSTNLQKRQIRAKFRNDKEYRDLFVEEQIFSRLPLKIRNMRKRRNLKQRELAAKARVAPEWITQVENPNYGRFTLRTLLKIAAAFDVALFVDFVPYSRILNDATNLSQESFDVPSAKEDIGLRDPKPPMREGEQTEERKHLTFADYQREGLIEPSVKVAAKKLQGHAQPPITLNILAAASAGESGQSYATRLHPAS